MAVTFVLLRSHIYHRKNKKASMRYGRMDIVHQCLMALLDSPLNRAGNAQIFVHSIENVLIRVEGETRVPRSLHRFRGLIDNLLVDGSVKSTSGDVLMKVIKNPVREHLPPNTIKFGLSHEGEIKKRNFFKQHASQGYVVFLNADQKSDDFFPDAEFRMKLSEYPLSAFVCCTKVCSLFEDVYGIF